MHGHQGYIERKNRSWNPRTEPTGRERDMLLAIDHIVSQSMRASCPLIAEKMGISRAAVHHHRDALMELGLVEMHGIGATSYLVLTLKARAIL